MPHKNITLWQWLVLVLSAPSEAVKVFLALLAGEVARWLLNSKARLRYAVGDLIACVLVYYAILPFIKAIPTIHGVTITPDLVVLIIALLGAHGVKSAIGLVVKKVFGVDLKGALKDENQ
ncbi:hypothetical protein KWI12_19795 [Citrobacter cronae]|uniref:hypothetical protein n=1 Tax=Citrobacter cronae TaxID=1748967 RepID=UPI0021D23E55|nr:hypothetical protein [Citrobacter cronae]MCU6199102.1 hypothetical protein [Citrobacter cronae]